MLLRFRVDDERLADNALVAHAADKKRVRPGRNGLDHEISTGVGRTTQLGVHQPHVGEIDRLTGRLIHNLTAHRESLPV